MENLEESEEEVTRGDEAWGKVKQRDIVKAGAGHSGTVLGLTMTARDCQGQPRTAKDSTGPPGTAMIDQGLSGIARDSI